MEAIAYGNQDSATVLVSEEGLPAACLWRGSSETVDLLLAPSQGQVLGMWVAVLAESAVAVVPQQVEGRYMAGWSWSPIGVLCVVQAPLICWLASRLLCVACYSSPGLLSHTVGISP